MRIIKRIALVFSLLLVLVIGVAIAIPIIFQDEMIAVVKEQINTNINATADFDEVDMSLLRSFPHLSLTLTDFTIVGKDQFDGVPFLSAKESAITVNIKSFLGENTPLEINAIKLSEPFVNVMVLADGVANYDIAIPSASETPVEEESAATALEIALKSYQITDGRIVYDDQSSDIFMAIEGLNHEGEGNFTLTNFDLDTDTNIAGLTVKQGGVTFLKEAKTSLAAIFNIDTENSSYTLKDNQLRINELALNADGNIQLLDEDIKLDLSFDSPGSDFRSLWSLIPNAYTADYADVAVDGTFSLSGLVKGIYNESTYPAFRILTKVNDGQVKYPDLPLAIQGIQADLDINSPSSDLDDMKVKADRLDIKVGSDEFKSKFQVSTPISDPNVAAQVDGIIDLEQWAKAFPLDGVQEMVGRIIADVDVQTRLSTIENERYNDVKMSGDVKVEQLRYVADELPPVFIESATAQFTPQAVNVGEFKAKLGKSDISASGSIDNILAYISPEKTMKGDFTAHSNYFFVDEWMEESETEMAVPDPTAEVESTEIFDRFDFQLDATADKIVYDVYELNSSSLTGRVKPNLIDISDVKTNIGESDLKGSGTVTNGFDYAFSDGVLGGNLNMQSNFFDLNPFMEEPEGEVVGTAGTGDEEFGVIPIPENITMTINTQIDRLRYTDMELKDLSGKLTIEDQVVVVENGSAKALGGSMGFTGAYDTQDVEKPAYNFKFDLNQLDFQEGFSTFNTFAAFAPVGQLVTGNFSSSLVMSGELGQDMMPLLNAVNAEGLFETLNGSLNGLKPLTAIGNALDINELKESIEIDNLKSWFTIEKGFFTVEPFDVNVANLPMTITGKHSLSQDMEYSINTVIPRSMLGSGALSNTINQGVSALLQQANQLGLNVNDSENVNVQINLTGNMSDPKVGFKLLGTDGESSLAESAKEEAKEQVKDKVDELKEEARDQVAAVQEQATEQVNQAADSLRNLAAEQAEAAGQAALETAREQAGALVDSTGLGKEANDAIDKIKDDIKDFNPFRRKKKKDGDGDGR